MTTTAPSQVNFRLESAEDNAFLNTVYGYAAEAHSEQVRKYTGEPYVLHPLAVALIVRRYYPYVPAIAAALLHDTLEDTEAEFSDLHLLFGQEIAGLVYDLTDVSKPSDGNRKVRKELDRQHIAQARPVAKLVKLADLHHNIYSIVKYDASFARVYCQEKAYLLETALDRIPMESPVALREAFQALRSRVYRTLNNCEVELIRRSLQA